MQIQEPPIEYWKLTYLQYIIKPQLLIDYISSLFHSQHKSGSQQQIYPSPKHLLTILYESILITFLQLLQKLTLEQKSKPFKEHLSKASKHKRLFFLLIIMWKQTIDHKDLWIRFVEFFKVCNVGFVKLFQEQLMLQIPQSHLDVKLIFQYYKNSQQLNKLKKNSNLIKQYSKDWMDQQLSYNLNQKINAHIKEKYLQLIKTISIVCKFELPEHLKHHFSPQKQSAVSTKVSKRQKVRLEVENNKKQKLAKIQQILDKETQQQHKLPLFLASTDTDTQINYLISKIFDLSQLIPNKTNKYKSYIKQIFMKQSQMQIEQKSTLYSLLLILKIVDYTNHYQNQIAELILDDIQHTIRQIKQTYQISIKMTIQIISALSYLENYISVQNYSRLHNLITFMLSLHQNQKQKKQYYILVIFVTFFSFKLNDSNSPMNFTKLWKRIVEEGNEEFIENIYSIYFIQSLVSFNSVVLNKKSVAQLAGFKPEQIFQSQLSNVRNVEIEINQCFTNKQIIGFLQKKKRLLLIVEKGNNIKIQESSAQIAKYYLLNQQQNMFFQELLNHCSFIYTKRIGLVGTIVLPINPLFFRLLSSIVFSRGFYILALICIELEDEKLDVKKFAYVQQLAERVKQPVQVGYLRYCSPQLLKILLKYCKRTRQEAVMAQIVNEIKQPNNYQYFTVIKKGRIKVEKQYEFVKWIYSIFTQS